MAAKRRIDILLVEKGYCSSREKARASIMAGDVMVNGKKVDKPGQNVDANDVKILIREKMPYVSRGGYKLARALQVFDLNLQGKVVIDIGASTGGFTDCALQNGAARVYAIDVGYGQIAWSLRNDPRVIVLERTNIRFLEKEVFTLEIPQFVTIDVSFISLSLVLPKVDDLLETFSGIALVKPQFEAGRENIGKKGVVKDPEIHRAVLHKVTKTAIDTGIAIRGLDYSPIKGPEGNIEYLMYFQKPGMTIEQLSKAIDDVVTKAHNNLI